MNTTTRDDSLKRVKQIGIIMMLAGFFMPLYLLFFTSGYDPGSSLTWNLSRMEIVLRDKHWVKPSQLDEIMDHLSIITKKEHMYSRFGNYILKPKIAIRYKHIVLFSLFLVFIGSALMPLSEKR